MNPYLLADMADWLETESIGVVHGVSLFSGRLPDTENNAIALLLYGANPASFVMDPEDNQPITERPTVQMLVRHEDFDAGLRTAIEAHRALLRLAGQTFQHTRFKDVAPIQSVPFYTGDDADGDPLFSCNYVIEVEP